MRVRLDLRRGMFTSDESGTRSSVGRVSGGFVDRLSGDGGGCSLCPLGISDTFLTRVLVSPVGYRPVLLS